MDYLAERIKHEMKISKETGLLNEEQRKKELEAQKSASIAKQIAKSKKQEDDKKETLQMKQ